MPCRNFDSISSNFVMVITIVAFAFLREIHVGVFRVSKIVTFETSVLDNTNSFSFTWDWLVGRMKSSAVPDPTYGLWA